MTDFPEFSSEKPEVVTRHIGYAAGATVGGTPLFLDESRWEGYYTRGLGYWVAHSIVMEKRRIAMGPVADGGDLISGTLETVGAGGLGGSRVSKSRSADAVARRDANPYYESLYGKEFLRLAKIAGKAAVAL